jgi:hypothetical protein
MEPEFVNFKGAQESIPPLCRTGRQAESIPGLLKFTYSKCWNFKTIYGG